MCAIVNLYRLYVIRLRELSGGYCGGVPPLPIPNREVKPTCADGTAMQCGRVGGRHLLQSTLFQQRSKVLFFVSSLYGSTEHTEYTDPRSTQSTRKIVEDYFHDFDTQAKAGLKPMASTAQDNALRTLCSIPQPRLVRTKLKSVASTTVTLTLHLN